MEVSYFSAHIIADTRYSDETIRMTAAETLIPYPANQKSSVQDLLRVNKKFRTYGSEGQKNEYHFGLVFEIS